MKKKFISDRITFYQDNKKLIDAKGHNFVPFYGFPKLQKYIPGIVPSIMYKITSHMGVGKTQLAKYLFIYQPMMYALKYKIPFKVIYFALEESKEEFIDSLFIHLLKRLHKIKIDRFSLTGYSTTSLTQAQLDAIVKTEKVVQQLMQNIIIVDDRYTPTALFNTCKYYANKWGKFTKDSEGNDTLYVPNDPKQVVLVVTDHISLLEEEYDDKKGTYLSDRQTIAKWHTKMARRVIAKQWRWAMLHIQQQTLESEKQQFTSRGDSIVNKILPSLDGLANNKEVGRDDYVCLGLFAPNRYSLESFRGYDIVKNTPTAFGDRFRSLHLLKNRFGEPNKVLPLYFDGSYNYFREMPLATDPKIDYFYKLLTK